MVCTIISEEYTILIVLEKEYDLTVSVAGAGKVQNWVYDLSSIGARSPLHPAN